MRLIASQELTDRIIRGAKAEHPDIDLVPGGGGKAHVNVDVVEFQHQQNGRMKLVLKSRGAVVFTMEEPYPSMPGSVLQVDIAGFPWPVQVVLEP